MPLKERLRNSPWLINWKYPLVYFALGTVLIMLYFITAEYEEHKYANILNFTIPIFTFVIYFARIAGDKLSDDFIVKKYNHLPFLLNFIVILSGLMLATIPLTIYHNYGLTLVFIFATAIIAALIYHIWQPYKKHTNLISFGIIILFFGLLQYSIAATALLRLGGDILWIVVVSISISTIFIVAGIVSKVRYIAPQPTLESLNLRFDRYLNRLFKNLPMAEDLVTLREQLKVSFVLYLEENFTPDVNEEKLFYRALDNFGNFAPILYPYRKNILARLAGTNNKVANFMLTFVLQLGLCILYVSTFKEDSWKGLLETMIPSIILPIFLMSISVFVLLIITRLVMNFKNKNHLITPSLIGGMIVIPLIIIYIVLNSAIDSFSKTLASTILIIIMSAVAVGSTALQTIFILHKNKKRGKIEEQ